MVLLAVISPSYNPSRTNDLSAIAKQLTASPWLFIIGATLTISGTSIRIISYRYLGRFFTFELSIRDDHKLVTDGPYRIVRHPSYTAGCVFLLGSLWCQLGPVSIWSCFGLWKHTLTFVIGVTQICLAVYASYVAAVLRVAREDKMLREQFGEEWEAWARKTPYKVAPFIH